MSWVLYLFGSGQALFLGAAMILAAVALLPRTSGWRSAALAMVARIGLVLVVLSAVPLSYWLYALAIGVTVVWLWRERQRGRESLPKQDPAIMDNVGSAKTPDPVWRRQWWRRATAVVWLGIIALELPHQFAPRLPPLGNPPVLIIGDSVTAGAGAGEKHLWPDLLPESVEVHNLAQPGATTGMALRKQASQLPAEGGLVLIEIGGNDLLGETSAAEFERDLDALLALASGSAGASPSQLSRTIVMFELPLPPLCNEYGLIQRRLAVRYGVRLIPKRVFMSVLSAGGATLDSIHLSGDGHRRMADEVWSVIGPAYR